MTFAARQASTRSAVTAPAGSPAEQRDAKRFTLLIRAAKLITEQGEFLCVIRDVSETGLSVTLFHELPDCNRLVIQFQNGDRHNAELVWQREGRAGFRFTEPADVVRIIESPSAFSKRPVRVTLELAAILQVGLERHPVQLIDISQQGARVSCEMAQPIDRPVKLLVEGMPETDAKIRWRRAGECGLVFENTFQLGELAAIVAAWNGLLPVR